MIDVQIENNGDDVAAVAADITAICLGYAAAEYGEAVWSLSGGTTPLKSYSLLAQKYADKLPWDKIKFILGDERCVSTGQKLTNLEQIEEELLSKVPLNPANVLVPMPAGTPQDVALSYDFLVSTLPANDKGIPRIDLLWLGVGEDGHTLSLFPGNEPDKLALVTFVPKAPKEPPQRISLTLKALQNVHNCVIMANGNSKAAIIPRLLRGDMSLPICQAVDAIGSNGGQIKLLLDQKAASKIPPA